jgi:hypothetical protein
MVEIQSRHHVDRLLLFSRITFIVVDTLRPSLNFANLLVLMTMPVASTVLISLGLLPTDRRLSSPLRVSLLSSSELPFRLLVCLRTRSPNDDAFSTKGRDLLLADQWLSSRLRVFVVVDIS